MKDINNSDKEKMLISGKSIEELINMKISEEFRTVRQMKEPKVEKISDITKLSSELIFSKNAVFKVFNKNTRTESLINGIQAEGMLGIQDSVRGALLSGRISAFISGESFVEFLYVKTVV